MLLNVFRSCGSIRTVLRNFRLSSYLSSAGGVVQKKRNAWFFKVPKLLKGKTPEEIENLKIVPEGYRLIYYSRDVFLINVARLAVVSLFAVGTYIGVQSYLNPESIKLREGFFSKTESAIIFFLQAIIFYVLATRHVYYIFRNEDSYKTVYYGFFGKLQTRIIDHKSNELLMPDRKAILPFFHYLRGKPLIISPTNFNNKMEYSMLLKHSKPPK